MAEYNEFYRRAIYYDIVFSRDVSREVDFAREVYRRLAGVQPASMLETACGPGYHARQWARTGGRAVGLDLRPEMIEFAREKAAGDNVDVEWIAADMRSFVLAAPVDVVMSPFDGLDALITNDDLIQHFRCVAENLTPSGLYIIDYTHPRDCGMQDYGVFHYHGSRDGITVDIEWATNNPWVDLPSGVIEPELTLRVNDRGEQIVIHDRACERFLSPQEVVLLCQIAGTLRVVDWYGDYALTQPLDFSPAARRMIGVLQKI